MTRSYFQKPFFALLAIVALCLAVPTSALAQPANDDNTDPEAVDADSGCIGDEAYSNAGATPDGVSPSCSPLGGNNANVWFEIEATETFLRIDVQIGGPQGTMRYPVMALYDDGFTEVACATWTSGYSDLTINIDGLLAGETYYLSVDCLNGYEGTFGLCVNTETNSFRDGAANVPVLNTCYNDGNYTTVGYFPDGAKPGCWYYVNPNNNSWFVFTATTTQITITMHAYAAFGTLRYPMIALEQDNGTVIDCARFTNGGTKSLQVIGLGLTPGETYYVNVDNAGGVTKQGTFT